MGNSAFGTIIEIGNILVSEDVVFECFSCDYAACKGQCCISGDAGAPLKEEELECLERGYDAYAPLMRPQGRAAVEATGFFEVDRDGNLVTPVVPVTHECAYAHFEADGSCLCAIERCFFAGKCDWQKPISCRLYPIRVTPLTGGGLALNLHRWDICRDAYAKGKKEGTRVYQFLREPLTEAFGEEFYAALEAAAAMLLRPDSGI